MSHRRPSADSCANPRIGSIIKGLEFDPMASGLVKAHNGQQVLEINRAAVENVPPV